MCKAAMPAHMIVRRLNASKGHAKIRNTRNLQFAFVSRLTALPTKIVALSAASVTTYDLKGRYGPSTRGNVIGKVVPGLTIRKKTNAAESTAKSVL